jgi:hypothetical protein
MVDKTSLVLAFFVAAVLAGVFVQYGPMMSGPSGAGKEHFMQQQIGMPLNAGGIGPYDQVSITGVSGWAATEPAPVGVSPANQTLDSNKLMLMVGNKTSTDCCPAPFNTDTGCVCLSESEKKLFASRGGNKA